MIETKIKILYLIVLSFMLFISIYLVSKNPTRGVVCFQENGKVICKNLALVSRNCLIVLENSIVERKIEGLSEIKIENAALRGWSCQ